MKSSEGIAAKAKDKQRRGMVGGGALMDESHCMYKSMNHSDVTQVHITSAQPVLSAYLHTFLA